MQFAVPITRHVYLAPLLRRMAAAWVACVLAGAASAQTLYWDTNSTTAGAGATPSATWSTTGGANKKWSTSSAGTLATANWTSGADAVFSAGTDATGAYTVTVSGTQNVSSITVEEGHPTFSGGTAINFSDATPDFTVASGSTATVSTDLTGTNGLTKLGAGTVIFGTNDKAYTGTTTISAGTLQLNFNQTFTTVALAGGTLALNSATTTITTLNLSANSTIDFSSSVNTTLNLTTLNLNGFTLNITNWTAASDFFYSTNWTGATYDTMGSSPMNLVTFNGFTASQTGWDSFDNQIRPNVPEPSTYGALLIGAMTALFAWRRRRA